MQALFEKQNVIASVGTKVKMEWRPRAPIDPFQWENANAPLHERMREIERITVAQPGSLRDLIGRPPLDWPTAPPNMKSSYWWELFDPSNGSSLGYYLVARDDGKLLWIMRSAASRATMIGGLMYAGLAAHELARLTGVSNP